MQRNGPQAVTEKRRAKVVQCEHLAPVAAQWLSQRHDLIAVGRDESLLMRELPDAEALVVRTYTRVDDQLLEAAVNLRVVARAGAGLDNIDVAACRQRGIEVVYAPDANTQAVVEYVVSLLTDALRPRIALTSAVTASEWDRLRAETVGQRELGDLIMGILGLGRVGKRMAKAATGLGMKVLYCDLEDIPPNQRGGGSPVSAQVLFEYADVLSVHIDGRPSNTRLVAERFFRRMQSHAIFINTSRGSVVDSAALAGYLKANPDALALLDVHEPEPFGEDYPLLGLPNARLYPHLASRTEQAMENMSWVVRDVVAVLDGQQPQFPAPDEP